jgi:prepilin-type N-terminal cleavage/methylation domain-containing protein
MVDFLKLRRLQHGFTIIEALVVMIISSIAMGLGSTWYKSHIDNMLNKSAAEHAKTVADASISYIKDHYSEVTAVATSFTPAKITIDMLKNTNYLPQSFTNNSPYGQSYEILALEPITDRLETLVVTTGGDTISGVNLRRLARLIGAMGGSISATDTSRATGSFGGWSMPLSNYGVSPGAGHVAVALFFHDGALTSDYVYRNAIPGRPELNQMNTPIHMRAIVTEDTSDVLCTGGDTTTYGRMAVDVLGSVVSCREGVWKRYGDGRWKDPVPSFANLPVSGNNIGDIRVVTALSRAFTWNGAHWDALAVDEHGNLRIPGTADIGTANIGTANIGTANVDTANIDTANVDDLKTGDFQVTAKAAEDSECSGEGRLAVSTTTSGLILSCQSGAWRKLGGAVGGAYISWSDGRCGVENSMTGGCSCPAGYSPLLVSLSVTYIGDWITGADNSGYVCIAM